MKPRIVLLLAAGWMSNTAWARAEASQTDRNLAQSLFEEAKQLMDAGNYADACPKLAESQRLDPGGGTLLNLALCREKEGKLASAWSSYKEALGVARRDGRTDRAQAAEERIAALEPQLPWLTIDVSQAVDGESVLLDGAEVGQAAWGTPLSLDPGTHALSAAVAGRQQWTSSITIAAGEKKTVEVPALEPAVAQPVAAPTPAASPTPTPMPATPVAPSEPMDQPTDSGPSNAGQSTTAAWIVLGAGMAALGTGGYFGVRAFQKHNQSNDECPGDTTCSPRGVTLNDQALTAAWISNVGIGLGLVGIGVGTYLLLSGDGAESSSPSTAGAVPSLVVGANAVPGGGQVALQGAW